MYSYKKKCIRFGIIDSIYYSKYTGYTVVFTNKETKSLLKCKLWDFKYDADKNAFLQAMDSYYVVLDTPTYVTYGDID